jgi:membrane dipeptidase
MMERIRKGIDDSDGKLRRCVTAGEVREAVAAKKLAVFLSVEGAHILGGRMEAVEWFYERGMRYLTLGHFSENEAVFSSNDRKNAGEGLKPFGRELVGKLEELGVMVDVAHVAPGCFRDVVKMARRPVFVSHIGMKAVREHWRNLDDEQVRAVAETGGVIGIIFSPLFLSRHFWACSLNTVVRHFEHCLEVAGEDHVALGSDWDGFITVPKGLEDVTGLPLLTQRLLDRGHSRETVRKVLGENFMRIFGEVCG